MRAVVVAVALIVSSTAVAGPRSSADAAGGTKGIIRCTAKGKPEIIMTLNAERKLGRVVSCISGDFIADMTPCAPNGGYGLSRPTGSASLARIVDRWQDYGDHMGGVTSHNADASRIHFDGGFFSPGDGKSGSRWSSQWAFTANRLTGEGKLTEDGKPDAIYNCAKATQRF